MAALTIQCPCVVAVDAASGFLSCGGQTCRRGGAPSMATHAPRTPASLSLSPRSIAASHRAAVAAPQAKLSPAAAARSRHGGRCGPRSGRSRPVRQAVHRVWAAIRRTSARSCHGHRLRLIFEIGMCCGATKRTRFDYKSDLGEDGSNECPKNHSVSRFSSELPMNRQTKREGAEEFASTFSTSAAWKRMTHSGSFSIVWMRI